MRSKVNSVSEAVILLGFNAVRNIVVSISVIKNFSNKKGAAIFDLSSFWKHSIAVAIVSKHLAATAFKDKDEDCFVGGLLHDIGKIIILECFPDMFDEIITAAIVSAATVFMIVRKQLSPLIIQ